MQKLVLYGGIDIRKTLPAHLREFDRDLYFNKSVFVFDITAPIDQVKDKWRANIDEYFNKYEPKKLEYASDNLQSKDEVDLIKYDVVHLGGGDTEFQNKYLLAFGFDKKLHNFRGLIIGNSAGALNMCRETIITEDDEVPQTKMIQGLGLIDDSVEVHYVDGENDEELLELSKGRKIYAIPENSVLIVEEEEKKCIGNIWLFENNIKKKVD